MTLIDHGTQWGTRFHRRSAAKPHPATSRSNSPIKSDKGSVRKFNVFPPIFLLLPRWMTRSQFEGSLRTAPNVRTLPGQMKKEDEEGRRWPTMDCRDNHPISLIMRGKLYQTILPDGKRIKSPLSTVLAEGRLEFSQPKENLPNFAVIKRNSARNRSDARSTTLVEHAKS